MLGDFWFGITRGRGMRVAVIRRVHGINRRMRNGVVDHATIGRNIGIPAHNRRSLGYIGNADIGDNRRHTGGPGRNINRDGIGARAAGPRASKRVNKTADGVERAG